MEHGNIGNAYIIVGLLDAICKLDDKWIIYTTLQLTDELARTYGVIVLPISSYDPKLSESSDFESPPAHELAREFDLVLDLSGDLMGPNADLIYQGRQEWGMKMSSDIAKNSQKYFALGVSPGPFETSNQALAAIGSYDQVFAREPYSFRRNKALLPCERLKFSPCPSILYPQFRQGRIESEKNVVGIAPSIWNVGAGSKASLLERQIEEILAGLKSTDPKVELVYFSHANSFAPERLRQGKLELGPGNDWRETSKLRKSLLRSFPGNEMGPLRHEEMAGFISSLNFLITGRIHATVAAHSQGVPAWMLDYRWGPRPLKNKGFMELFDASERLIGQETRMKQIRTSTEIDFKNERARLLDRHRDLTVTATNDLKEILA